jgi:hypothetical protein
MTRSGANARARLLILVMRPAQTAWGVIPAPPDPRLAAAFYENELLRGRFACFNFS